MDMKHTRQIKHELHYILSLTWIMIHACDVIYDSFNEGRQKTLSGQISSWLRWNVANLFLYDILDQDRQHLELIFSQKAIRCQEIFHTMKRLSGHYSHVIHQNIIFNVKKGKSCTFGQQVEAEFMFFSTDSSYRGLNHSEYQQNKKKVE